MGHSAHPNACLQRFVMLSLERLFVSELKDLPLEPPYHAMAHDDAYGSNVKGSNGSSGSCGGSNGSGGGNGNSGGIDKSGSNGSGSGSGNSGPKGTTGESEESRERRRQQRQQQAPALLLAQALVQRCNPEVRLCCCT